MSTQEFEMAAQVCAGDNILWKKLLLLPKFSFPRINQDSSDYAYIRIGDDWRGLLKTKIEIIKKQTGTRSLEIKKINETGTKGKQIYYEKKVSGILWLKPIMELYLSITVKLFLFLT